MRMNRVFKAKPNLVTVRSWIIGYIVAVAIGALVVSIFFRGQCYTADQVAVVIAIPMIIAAVFGRIIWSVVFRGSSQDTEKDKTKLGPFAFTVVLCLLLALFSLFLCLTFATSCGIYLLLGLNWAFVTIWPGFIILLLKVAGGLVAFLLIMIAFNIFWNYRSRLLNLIIKTFKASGVSSKGIQLNGLRLRLR